MLPIPPNLLAAAAAAFAVSSTAFAADAVAPAQALEAIRVFEANACGNLAGAPRSADESNELVARASNTILKFAQESDAVIVDLGPDAVPWCDVRKGVAELGHSGERGLLLAAYVAGSVRAQLQAGRTDASPYSGWSYMLRVYRIMKARQGVAIPEVEVLAEQERRGSLDTFAADTERKSLERLRRTYGERPPQALADDGRQ